MTVQGQSRLHHSPPKPAARSRLIIGDFGPSDSALAAARGWRLRRPAADRHAARCASRDLCSGGAPRRYPPSKESFVAHGIQKVGSGILGAIDAFSWQGIGEAEYTAATGGRLLNKPNLAKPKISNRSSWYLSDIQKAAFKYAIDPNLIRALGEGETNFENITTAPGNGVGLLQVKPTTAGLTVDQLKDPAINIPAGAKYLRKMLDRYNGDIEKAVAAYNAGPGGVDQALQYGPGWKEHLPRGERNESGVRYDTKEFVEKVITIYVDFRDKHTGERLGEAVIPLASGAGPTTSPGEYKQQ